MPKGRMSAAAKVRHGRRVSRSWEQWRARNGHLFKFPHRRGQLVSDGVRRNERYLCNAPHCSRNRDRIGRYCDHHDGRWKRTGSPIGRTIRRIEWLPWLREAAAFINEQSNPADGLHDSLRAALAYFAREIAIAKAAPSTRDAREHGYREALLYAARRGVSCEELLARWLAGALCEEADDSPLIDDGHRQQQRARLLLLPSPFTALWSAEDGPQRDPRDIPRTTRADRAKGRRAITFGAKAHAFERTNASLGLLTVKAVRHIRSQRTDDTPDT